MILFINVYLEENSNSPFGHPNNRYNLKNYSKKEIFLYTLESYKVIDWSAVVIYCELADKTDEKDFHNEIEKIFPNAYLFKTRNAYQYQWQNAVNFLDNFSDDLVWYAGNHDHPYLAPNNIQLNRIIESLKNCDEVYKGAIYSHHPENLTWISSGFDSWKYEGNSVCSYYGTRAEGIMIVNKNTLRSWWFDHDYGDSFIPRSDWNTVHCKAPMTKIFYPVRLMCHHFDGYTFTTCTYEPNDVPPLEIPEGFWQNNIIIDYCSEKRIENQTWINPAIQSFKAVSEDGVDYKFQLEDLPMFWIPRISKINIYPYNAKKIRKFRNKALYESAAARVYYNNFLIQTKGINIAEISQYRPKISLKYFKDLLSLK